MLGSCTSNLTRLEKILSCVSIKNEQVFKFFYKKENKLFSKLRKRRSLFKCIFFLQKINLPVPKSVGVQKK